MRIDQLDVYYVAMPLIAPWRTAYGADYDIHSVLVKATSGDHYGWSESTPFFAPTYLNESAGSAYYHVTEVFGPQIVGGEYETAEDLNTALSIFKGNSFAKSAIEIAWWTLESDITGVPVHRLLGGATREVAAGADFGIQDSIDILLEGIQGAVGTTGQSGVGAKRDVRGAHHFLHQHVEGPGHPLSAVFRSTGEPVPAALNVFSVSLFEAGRGRDMTVRPGASFHISYAVQWK